MTSELSILALYGIEPRKVGPGETARAIAAEELRRHFGEHIFDRGPVQAPESSNQDDGLETSTA